MKPKLILCLALVLSGVGLWILLRPSEYQATALIKIEPEPKYIPSSLDEGPDFIPTDFDIIQSTPVLGKVIVALKLNVEWGKKYAGGRTLEFNETLLLLKQRLNFRLDDNTNFFDITVTDENHVEAAKIASAIAETFLEFRQERIRQESSISKGGAVTNSKP
jgi:uncharacterized protein involved in exopolysaccharide biosynthesis